MPAYAVRERGFGSPSGGGYGGFFGGGGAGPMSASMFYKGQGGQPSSLGLPSIPQPGAQLPFQPGGDQVQGLIGSLQETGEGLLDPNSAYSQRMRQGLSEDIGAQTAARQRSAALMAARGGLGAGASPELLETQEGLGRAGLEAYGDAATQAMLGGIGLGGQFLQPALSGALGLQGQQMSGWLQQQQLAADQQARQLAANMEAQRAQQEMMMRELSLLFGGFF